MKRIIHHDQVEFVPGKWRLVQQSKIDLCKQPHQEGKEKKFTIIPIDAEEASGNVNTRSYKDSQQTKNRGELSQLDKNIYKNLS